MRPGNEAAEMNSRFAERVNRHAYLDNEEDDNVGRDAGRLVYDLHGAVWLPQCSLRGSFRWTSWDKLTSFEVLEHRILSIKWSEARSPELVTRRVWNAA